MIMRLFYFALGLPVLSLLLGCGPSSQQRKEMVQCSSQLKQTLIRIEAALSDEVDPSTNHLGHALSGFQQCPVSGVLYITNPDLSKWLEASQHGSEVAIYCPEPHYKSISQTRYAAISFDGTILKLTNAPVWAKAKK
jgi:hypothetical protein